MLSSSWRKVNGVGNQILIKVIENLKKTACIYTSIHYFYGRIILSWLDSKGFQSKIYDTCLILQELLGRRNLLQYV
jgi:hypothetical protein